jgi:hypothetical protein
MGTVDQGDRNAQGRSGNSASVEQARDAIARGADVETEDQETS